MIRSISGFLAVAVCCFGQELTLQVLRDGKPVTDVQAADLRVVEQSQHKPVTSINRQSLPLDVVFVVEQRRWEPLDKSIRNAVMRITEGMKGDETAGLLTAGTEVRTIVQAGKKAPDFFRELGEMRGPRWYHGIGGPTVDAVKSNLLDAVVVGTRQLEAVSGPDRRRAIVIVGQNLTGPESTTIADAIHAAQNAKTIVTLVSLPEESGIAQPDKPPSQEYVLMRFPRRPPPPTSGQPLSAVIEYTGGQFLIDAKTSQFRQVIDNLRTRYVASFTGSNPVRVEPVPNGKLDRSKIEVSYPKPFHSADDKRSTP